MEKLLTSANNASGPARTAWLAFLGLLTYLLVTLAGVTDENLLLNSPVTLPIVNVKIPLFSFFLAAPFLVVLVHLSLLLQHVMLAHQYQRFSAAVGEGEVGPARDHADRHLVHNYVFSQMLAGSKPPWLLHMLMRLMVFVTLSLLPILVLLYFQIKFLPSHHVEITHAHRFAILLDLALLLAVRPFIAMPSWRTRRQKLRFGNQNWNWELSYWSFGAAVFMFLAVMSFSLLVATIPQACDWPIGKEPKDCFSLDQAVDSWLAILNSSEDPSKNSPSTMMWLLERKWLHRNLELAEATLIREGPSLDTIARYRVAGKTREDAFSELTRGLDLRKRDLRYANLRAARLDKADLREAQLQGAILDEAQLQRAKLQRVQLQGATLLGAQLQGVNLMEAKLQGTNLVSAQLQGANLVSAQLQGAELNGARLQGADLLGAQLQGADLQFAELQGANLLGAQLQGANLLGARLQGANLLGAQLQGADLRGTQIWKTSAPKVFGLEHAIPTEPAGIVWLDDNEISELQELIARFEDEHLRKTLQQRLEPLLDTNAAQIWESTNDHQAWVQFSELPWPDPAVLGDFLGKLSCEDGTGGHIIRSISLRISEEPSEYSPFIAKRILEEKEGCSAVKHLNDAMLARLRYLVLSE